MLLTEVWYKILSYLNNVHDLINLLYVSKFTRNYVLTKFDRSFFLNSGFCAFDFWIKKLNSNRVNLLSKLYFELDVFLDYDVWSRKLNQTMRHISLFSVCLHFFHCYRTYDKLPRSQYCFFGSRLRSRDFDRTHFGYCY